MRPSHTAIQQLVLADDMFAIPHQVEQQVEDLRPDGNRLGAAREFPALGVEHVVLKRELHLGPPRSHAHASDTRPRPWADAVSPGKD